MWCSKESVDLPSLHTLVPNQTASAGHRSREQEWDLGAVVLACKAVILSSSIKMQLQAQLYSSFEDAIVSPK